VPVLPQGNRAVSKVFFSVYCNVRQPSKLNQTKQIVSKSRFECEHGFLNFSQTVGNF